MKYNIKAYSIYEFGQRKDTNGNPHQEDSIYPKSDDLNSSDRLFILCDGMGGHEAGEVASQTVCDAMSDYILKFDPQGAFSETDFKGALDAAYNALDKEDQGGAKKMGTTMTFLKLHSAGALIAHIGDSRVYQFRPGETAQETKIIFRTQDHSLVNDLIKIGELTEEEARNSKQKNVITRAMQPHGERRCIADIYQTIDIEPGDWFYMCSDGMLEEATDDNLKFIFSNASFKTGEEKKAALLENSKFNKDNHSAILVEIIDIQDPIDTESAIRDENGVLEAIIDETEIIEPFEGMTPPVKMSPVERPLGVNSATKRKNNNLLWTVAGVVVVLILALLCYLFIVVPGKEKKSVVTETEDEIELVNPADENSYDATENQEGMPGQQMSREEDNAQESGRKSVRNKKNDAATMPAKVVEGVKRNQSTTTQHPDEQDTRAQRKHQSQPAQPSQENNPNGPKSREI